MVKVLEHSHLSTLGFPFDSLSIKVVACERVGVVIMSWLTTVMGKHFAFVGQPCGDFPDSKIEGDKEDEPKGKVQ